MRQMRGSASAEDNEFSVERNSAGSRPHGQGRKGGYTFLERYVGVFVLILLIVIFSVWEPHTFLAYNNFVGILGNQAISGMIALGLLLPLSAGVFDLSVSGVMTLGIVAVTDLFQVTDGKIPIPIAIIVVLIGAIGVGLINSLLVVKVGVDPFIATIGTGSILVGISQLIANGTTITNNIPTTFTVLGRRKSTGSR